MDRRPNLLYVFADQWRADAVGFMNKDEVSTPNIDSFSRESMVFSDAISTFPLCSPHRASLMTGKYPYSAGIWTNCKTGLSEVLMLRPQEVCIGDVLKEYGYNTGYIGKWHLDASEMNFRRQPKSGAKDWDAYTPEGERRQGFDYWLSYGADDNHLNPHYWKDNEKQICPDKWSVEFETEKAIDYIEERRVKEEPFALFLSYNPPHLPYELVPDKYYKLYKDKPVHFRENVPKSMRTDEMRTITRQYFGAITGVDEYFGKIMNYLKEQGLEENTLVILSADHGEMLGSHGLMSKNVWYEEAIHIPLMMRQKGRITPGSNKNIFASPDHMPTILELLDMTVPDTCEGYSHKQNILSDDETAPRQAFICSYPGSVEMVRAFEKKGLNHKCYGWRGIRTKEYTFVISNGYLPGSTVEYYLYHNIIDIYQQKNLIETGNYDRELIERLKEKLKEYLSVIHDPFLMDM